MTLYATMLVWCVAIFQNMLEDANLDVNAIIHLRVRARRGRPRSLLPAYAC